jgi:hypothetical protein
MAKEAFFLTLNLLQIPQDAAPALGNAGHTQVNSEFWRIDFSMPRAK